MQFGQFLAHDMFVCTQKVADLNLFSQVQNDDAKQSGLVREQSEN